MLFSRDMMDTNFDNLNFPPKWRSSLSVYYYIVPDEDTADSYPNSTIVYLKLSCSITGWNPNEALRDAQTVAREIGTWDDLQRTMWETVSSSGWAARYWPCLGAIMQLAVYPNNRDGVTPDDYPYIIDFEPKKRELFEQVTEGGEFLSGSSEKFSTTKGSTNTQSVDVGVGKTILGAALQASASAMWQQIDTTTEDNSRERRESQSHSTSFSQMYQLFNGYHLGTNRALFVVAPRPHTASVGDGLDTNLINGHRGLEGLQEVISVIHIAKSLDGFCIQASLDTGHQATVEVPMHLTKNNVATDGTGPHPPHSNPPPPSDPVKQLVVTRRIAQACGTFDENGGFHLRAVREPKRDVVLGEVSIQSLPADVMIGEVSGEKGRAKRVDVANNLNIMQSQVNRSMLDIVSSGDYKNIKFEETNVFKSLVAYSLMGREIPITELVKRHVLTGEEAGQLARTEIVTVAGLFAETSSTLRGSELEAVRDRVIKHLFTSSRSK